MVTKISMFIYLFAVAASIAPFRRPWDATMRDSDCSGHHLGRERGSMCLFSLKFTSRCTGTVRYSVVAQLRQCTRAILERGSESESYSYLLPPTLLDLLSSTVVKQMSLLLSPPFSWDSVLCARGGDGGLAGALVAQSALLGPPTRTLRVTH